MITADGALDRDRMRAQGVRRPGRQGPAGSHPAPDDRPEAQRQAGRRRRPRGGLRRAAAHRIQPLARARRPRAGGRLRRSHAGAARVMAHARAGPRRGAAVIAQQARAARRAIADAVITTTASASPAGPKCAQLWRSGRLGAGLSRRPGRRGPGPCGTIAATAAPASPPADEPALVLYEYPFNEGIRTMLRLEHLFDRLGQLVRATRRWTTTSRWPRSSRSWTSPRAPT
jgi:hypothetical protein